MYNTPAAQMTYIKVSIKDNVAIVIFMVDGSVMEVGRKEGSGIECDGSRKEGNGMECDGFSWVAI